MHARLRCWSRTDLDWIDLDRVRLQSANGSMGSMGDDAQAAAVLSAGGGVPHTQDSLRELLEAATTPRESVTGFRFDSAGCRAAGQSKRARSGSGREATRRAPLPPLFWPGHVIGKVLSRCPTYMLRRALIEADRQSQ